MKIIGVSGFIGSGKSTMLEHLSENPRIKVIEADKISKYVIYNKKILNFLKKFIPNSIENEKIERTVLRSELFNNHKLNEKFTKVAWPLISKEINLLIKKEINSDLIFVEAAVISGIKVKFDKTILLVKDNSQRIDRVRNRDNRDLKEIDSITEFQFKKLRKYKFDYILENNSDKQSFFKSIDDLIEKIKSED
ncbi:dephospho-CoA kinase [Spiroplasma diminutum]|uniref:Dephospho-CoA kinase n=1 Tax=Spiroplasma diminutum CUAS-1 TaxID=1276221 RepID=S5LWJ9_9MOLU|nr:dephospho-CoA kinase [Spiroplasma diminutum]AGR42149.1 dephospho-CoA kinase [Spiroplasma diminutum CUAS-1]